MKEETTKQERPRLSRSQIKQFEELANLGGVHLSAEAVEVILQLLSLGAAPSSLNTVLAALCKPAGAAGSLRRHTASSAVATAHS